MVIISVESHTSDARFKGTETTTLAYGVHTGCTKGRARPAQKMEPRKGDSLVATKPARHSGAAKVDDIFVPQDSRTISVARKTVTVILIRPSAAGVATILASREESMFSVASIL
jgi:hypothetical protein